MDGPSRTQSAGVIAPGAPGCGAAQHDCAPTVSDATEDDWFVIDSYCRQEIWGAWADGDYQGDLGQINPMAPLTEAYFNACPALVAARP